MRISLYLTVMMLASPLICRAGADSGYFFSSVNYQSGLSHSAVLSIFQDRDGLMWFGTYDGVNCYDGRSVSVFKSDFSKTMTLSNNIIHNIIQAPGDNLWLNTHLGLDLFSRSTQKVSEVYRFNCDYSILSDSAGDTWVVSADSLWYYNNFHREFVRADVKFHGENPGLRSFVSESGALWHCPENSGRMDIYTVSSFDADSASVHINVSRYDLHDLPVKQMFYQSGDICFIDSRDDLYIYNIWNKSKIFIRNIGSLLSSYGEISGLTLFYDDIVLGFKTSGLFRLANSGTEPLEELDRNLRIYGLYRDEKQGILWVATDGAGAVYYAKKKPVAANNLMLRRLSRDLTRPVRSIMTDMSGNLWFGTKGDGLVRVSSAGGGYKNSAVNCSDAVIYFPGRKEPASLYSRRSSEFQVYSMEESRSHDGFWVGSGATGLYWYSAEKDGLFPVKPSRSGTVTEIHAIYEESDSVLYIASAIDGVHRLRIRPDGNSFRIVRDRRYRFYDKGQDISMFYPMISDGDSLLWIGSRGKGLVKLDRRTDEYYVISLGRLTGKSVDDILSLCLSEKGRKLYVGTTAGLVTLDMDSGSLEVSYTGREQGLLNDMIHGILEDKDGFLWLSTNRGLIKYNPETDSAHTYYYSAGIEVGEFCDDAYFKSPDTGYLFFGGIDGLLWIDGKNIAKPSVFPDIVLRDVKVGNARKTVSELTQDRKGVRTMVLEGPRAVFSISFAVPDFLSGENIEYSWKLDGYDSDWSVFSNSNRAEFINVPSGNYIFRVKYKMDIFDTEYKILSLPVAVLYPWYSSPVARILYLSIFVLGIVSLGFYVYNSGVAKQELPAGSSSLEEGHQAGLSAVTSAIYRNIATLRLEGTSFKDRCIAVDRIREAVLSYGYPEILSSSEWRKSCLPERWCVVEETDIPELLKDIIAETGKRQPDIIPGVFGTMAFPVYRNAFSLLFYFCFSFIKRRRADVKVYVSQAGNGQDMKVSLESAGPAAGDLYGILSGKSGYGTLLQGGEDEAFSGRLLAEAAIEIVEKYGGLSVSGSENHLEMIFKPARTQPEGSGKRDLALVMSESADMLWLASEILSGTFAVHTAKTHEEAFEKLSSAHFSVFLADLDMSKGRENDFMQMMYAHRFSVSGVRFIPMFSWKTSLTMSKEMLRISDSYMMLPYDITFLKEIVHRAVYGKSPVVPIYIEELVNLGIDIRCESKDDTVFARKVVNVIDSSLDRDDLGSQYIADSMAMSYSQFFRRFKKIFGMSPENFIKTYRIEKAARLLQSSQRSVSQVMFDVGISSRSYFYREFSARFGVTPKEYKQQNGKDNG